ncbi:MAG TPA: 4a-hydroxytetrahydrobiopterin dehydratase [Leptospiraceae bacterium]|nr:4a-hydroxytetrahydrobiopterin dehydratase [Leptospiraceae bacterium]HMW03873.1 4a-hydroxytetrahydrobiopterin dehydratase [Leptospiraceae bacterium]HMX34443.1 4a-hydroxytetrahydrobiopterin dehydratase [Leptospiraceae bacterium]HMY29853.1 4a-hydroxytetrahydrobiopterin dehydratase [Leptospiraceae bacterium]HMZ63003.1 4a-hydroxytetrahydrobiopterin dehydratase [Leptospiraceae bacterium]
MSKFSQDEILSNIKEQCPDWSYEGLYIVREFLLKNFISSLQFVNSVGFVAEGLDHHPEISIKWDKVRVQVYTHSIGGVGPLDFSLAAKIDQFYKLYKEIG